MTDTLAHPTAPGLPGAVDATEMDSGRLRSHLDRLQRRQRLQADTALLVRAHQRELRHWQDQLLRQSALLLIEHTRAAWGLVPGLSAQPWPPTPAAAPWAAGQLPQAHAVICRTGCALDHDHWRDGDQCRRTGQACDRRPDGGGA